MRFRPARLLVLVAYVVPLAVAAVLLVTIGDWVLTILLLATEAVVVALTRHSQRTPPPTEPMTGPRLGTPLDPGRPSGRRPPRRYS